MEDKQTTRSKQQASKQQENSMASQQALATDDEEDEQVCPLCSVGNCECDCSKCGVTGCFVCVTGGHGLNEELNLCPECCCDSDDEEEKEEYICDCSVCGERLYECGSIELAEDADGGGCCAGCVER